MITVKPRAAHYSIVLLFAGVVLLALCVAGPAVAQQTRIAANGTIDAGTTLGIRTTEHITAGESNGSVFHGVVDQDVLGRNGNVVIPRGSDAELIVKHTSGNELALDLDSVVVNGRRFAVQSEDTVVSSKNGGLGKNKRTGEYVGGGAILGAIIGGIAGGGKGAAIGAGAGAAAGAGAQVLTKGGKIDVPSESLLTYRLSAPLNAGVTDRGYMRNGVHYHTGYNNPANAAYEQGLRDGRSDAERNQPRNAEGRAFVTTQDRRDYEAGYSEGYRLAR